MKKLVIPIIMILCGIIVGFIVTSSVYTFTGFSAFGSAPEKPTQVQDSENVEITMLAYKVLEYIRDDDFVALSSVVHPDNGVIFSPCATVNLTTDRHFSSEQIASLGSNTNVYVWGVFNGSGEPITLTPEEYIARFIPAAEHIDAAVLGINQVIRSGNALENLTDIFPNASFVDFHIPCQQITDEPNWRSLRLAFEEHNGYLRLVAIMYNKWAI